MNKRGQIYILAAVVLIVAIWGVVKVVNKVEGPSKEDNFDFYVENFIGERAYVMDLGYLQVDDPTKHFIDDLGNKDNLLNVFTELGFNVGVVMEVYDSKNSDQPWKVVNFLNQEVKTDCEGCNKIVVLQPAQGNAGGLSFSLTGEGKEFSLEGSSLNDLPNGPKYFVQSFGNVNEVYVEIDGNKYDFRKPIGKSKRVESILFKNLDEDYVKVVRV